MAVFKILLFSILIACFGAQVLRAQPDSAAFSFGAGASLNFDSPQGTFASLPGVFKSSRAENYSAAETQTGYSFSVFLLKPVSPWLGLGARLDFQQSNALFTAQERITYIAANGDPAIATNQYSLSAGYNSLGIQPEVSASFLKDFSFTAGLRFGFITRSSFTQSQRFLDAPGVSFTDPPQDTTGELPETSPVQFSISANLGYDLFRFKSFTFRPEIAFSQQLNSVLTAESWQNRSIRGGLSIVYTPQIEPFTFLKDTTFRRDTSLRLSPVQQENITLLDSRAESISDTADRTITERTTVFENYLRTIPQPAPLLSAQITAQTFHGTVQFSAQTIPVRKILRCSYMPGAGAFKKVSCDTVLALDSVRVKFLPDIISEAGVGAWELTIRHENSLLKTFSGSGEVAEILWQPEFLPEGKLNFTFTTDDKGGQTFSTEPGIIELQSPHSDVTHTQKIYSFAAENDAKTFLKSNEAALREIARNIQPESKVFLKAENDSFKKPVASVLKIPASRIVFTMIPAGEDVEINVENELD